MDVDCQRCEFHVLAGRQWDTGSLQIDKIIKNRKKQELLYASEYIQVAGNFWLVHKTLFLTISKKNALISM